MEAGSLASNILFGAWCLGFLLLALWLLGWISLSDILGFTLLPFRLVRWVYLEAYSAYKYCKYKIGGYGFVSFTICELETNKLYLAHEHQGIQLYAFPGLRRYEPLYICKVNPSTVDVLATFTDSNLGDDMRGVLTGLGQEPVLGIRKVFTIAGIDDCECLSGMARRITTNVLSNRESRRL